MFDLSLSGCLAVVQFFFLIFSLNPQQSYVDNKIKNVYIQHNMKTLPWVFFTNFKVKSLFQCFPVFCSNCRGVQESVETNWLKDLFYKIHAEPTGVNVSKVLIFTCVTQNHKRKNYEKYLLIILFLIVYSKQNLKLPYGKFQVTKFCFLQCCMLNWQRYPLEVLKTFLRLCKVEWRKLDLYAVVKGLFFIVCCTVSCQRSHLF